MSLKNHKLITGTNVHTPLSWTYASQSARESATGFISSDGGKLAWQTDNNSVWMLVEYSPPAWMEITGSGGGSGLPSTMVFWARKASEGTINKGQPVYIASYNDGGGYAEIELAEADVSSKMPAVGIAYEDIDNTISKRVAVFGSVAGINTSSWSETDPLYVSTTEGALTNSKPLGATSKIQKVGLVLHSDVSDGIIQVCGAGRTNDIPNIAEGKVWKGDSNGVPQEVSLDSEITSSTHAGRTDNPHSVTAAQAGAAASTHASGHQHGGSDEVATSTPGANAIPKAGAGGTLAEGWIQDASDTQRGDIELATQAEVDTGTDTVRAVTPATLAGTSLAGRDTDAIHDNASGEISALTEKTSLVDADLVLIEDSEASNAKKKVQRVNLLSIFGSRAQNAASEGESSTTSDEFQQKLRLTTPSLPAGTYRIGWYCELSAGAANDPAKFQVQLDDTTTLGGKTTKWSMTYSQGLWEPTEGFAYAILTADTHTIDLDYAAYNSGDTIYIKRARLEIWRVS